MSPKANPDEDDRDEKELEKELQRLRSMALSERPQPASSASVLSLANAHVASLADDDESPAPPASAPPPSSRAADSDSAKRTLLASGARAPVLPADLVAEMRDRFSLGDYTGALAAAESLLASSPEHVEAKRCADNCRSVLEQMYAARIGPLDRIPHVAVPREKLQWLSIDHRAGFVLSHVDGVSSLQMIMAACGMPALDVLRILHELVHSRVIAFR